MIATAPEMGLQAELLLPVGVQLPDNNDCSHEA
jgi:hypothetical protein